MIIKKTPFTGLFFFKFKIKNDSRGWLKRTFCKKQITEFNLKQQSFVFNKKKLTLRGMHYQVNNSKESKILTVINGKIFDVVIDLRKNSKTYLKHYKSILDNKCGSLFIPKGFAHGYLTLTNDVLLDYKMDNFYKNKDARGIRYNDKKFDIKWPKNIKIISHKDLNYTNY